jgi:hypothetical protein
MIGEFDRREGASSKDCASTAHWLNWKCGMALGSAREHVRVGRRLGELALVREEYAAGRLSFSKVRAITRVATADNEADLVYLAGTMTAEHLERLLRSYRRCTRPDDERAHANERDKERFLSTFWADDGTLLGNMKLAPENGATVVAALRMVMDRLRKEGGDDVSAETSDQAWDGWGAAMADALVAMAETVLANGYHPANGGDRHVVNVHVDAATLAGTDDGQGRCHLEDGPALPADTAARLACDASVVALVDSPDGEPVTTGRRTRTIPVALRRALKARDGGCVFPGCTHHRFVDAHHVQHWSQGGETSLANLTLLCRRCHRRVHEGGYRMHSIAPGQFVFYRPDGTIVDTPTITVEPGDLAIRDANHALAIDPTTKSLTPDWDGSYPDYGYIIDGLIHRTTTDVPAETPRQHVTATTGTGEAS